MKKVSDLNEEWKECNYICHGYCWIYSIPFGCFDAYVW